MWMADAALPQMPVCNWLDLLRWATLAGCALLAGCAEHSVVDDIEEYQSRLSRVLDTDYASNVKIPPLSYPPSDQLHQDVPEFSVNLREFYRLQKCELGTLVAERNTALGKTAQPSQRFVYETRLLQQLASCSAQLDDKALAGKLTQWRQAKLAQRPIIWANLVQTSQETRATFSRSGQLLTAEKNPDAGAAISALNYLETIRQDVDKPLEGLENELKVLDSARLPAKIWRTQRALALTLEPLTAMLATQLPLQQCPQGKASPEVEILRNVFYLFFIEKIQPLGSKLNQYHYQLLPLWQAWLEQPALSAPFKAYLQRQAIDGFAQYQAAIQQHVTLWQTLFARCNLSPQAPSA